MPATRSMPATKGTKGGDSKQALMISLICFVVLSIVLAVMAYMWYADGATAVAAEKKTKGEADSAKKDREWWKFQALALKDYAGYLQNKTERADLDTLRGNFDGGSLSGDGKEEVVNMVKTLDQRLGWDKNQKKPLTTYAQQVEELNTKLVEAQQKFATTEGALKKAQEDERAMEDAKDAEVKNWKRKFEEAQKENVALQKRMADELDKRLADFGDLSKQLADLKRQSDTDLQTKDRKAKRLEDTIKNLQIQAGKLREQLKPPDLTKFENPKGHIVRLDTRDRLAWIDLGSADNLRPEQNVTFSIFGAGDAGRPHERKGSLAVTGIDGPHLAVAKITEFVDQAHNPIMTGDLLVNPAWSPENRQHVAIAGLIDLNGQGRDSIDEFMRKLREQGVVVDAYLDLKDLTVKGQMTESTNYLILGEPPRFDPNRPIRSEEDPTVERKKEILDKIAAMRNEAVQLGATVVPVERFVQLTGYQIPRRARTSEGYGYDRPVISSGQGERQTPSAVKQKEKPKAKAGKKESEDSDEKKDDGDK